MVLGALTHIEAPLWLALTAALALVVIIVQAPLWASSSRSCPPG
ncbi:hypothetical protein [Miniimonas arenae]|nr:hypothetical protein [Miniimonas arenae]